MSRAAKIAFRGRAFKVTVERVRLPGGGRSQREIVRHGPSAVILAFDERGRVLLVRQYRAPAGSALWELPAGGVNDGERPFAAARRELREETGFSARRWRGLARFYASPGFLDETMHVYVARELTSGQTAFDDDEHISVRFFSPAQLRRMIRSGTLRDGKTLAAWAAWQAKAHP